MDHRAPGGAPLEARREAALEGGVLVLLGARNGQRATPVRAHDGDVCVRTTRCAARCLQARQEE